MRVDSTVQPRRQMLIDQYGARQRRIHSAERIIGIRRIIIVVETDCLFPQPVDVRRQSRKDIVVAMGSLQAFQKNEHQVSAGLRLDVLPGGRVDLDSQPGIGFGIKHLNPVLQPDIAEESGQFGQR